MESSLKDVLGETPVVTQLLTGFTAASGPLFSRRGYLLFCDSASDTIFKWQDGKRSVFRNPANRARSLTFDHQGCVLICEKGRVTRIEKNGSVTVLAGPARFSGMRDPLDVIFAVDANTYFCDGTTVYQIKRDQSAGASTRDCREPVALALSPNQTKLYVCDAGRRNVRLYDISATGSLQNGRPFAQVPSAAGVKTDESGRVWVLTPDGIHVFGADGAALGTVPVPEKPTGLNWAEGFRDLIVTTATSVYRVQAKTSGTRTY